MCKICTDKCMLEIIFPREGRGIACDSKCYFETMKGKKHLDWYKKAYKDKFDNNK